MCWCSSLECWEYSAVPRRRTLRFSMTLCIIRGPPSDTISPCRENGPALQPLSRMRARSSPRCQQAQCSSQAPGLFAPLQLPWVAVVQLALGSRRAEQTP